MYRSISFNSDARSRRTDPLSNYKVVLANPVRKVNEIRLGEIDLPKTSQYIVEEGLDRNGNRLNKNTLSFTENFRIAKNGLRYQGKDLYLPNHLTRAVRFDTKDDMHFFATNLPWSVDEYQRWGSPTPLELLGYGEARAMDVRPFVEATDLPLLNEQGQTNYNFLKSGNNHFFYAVSGVGNLGISEPTSLGHYPPDKYRRYYFHRARGGLQS